MRILALSICLMALVLTEPLKAENAATRSEGHTVKVSAYTTCPRETDATPTITASGLRLKKYHYWYVIALSRKLAKQYKFGDRFKLCFELENQKKCIPVIYEDRMGKRGDCVDLLAPNKKQAFKFGIRKAKLIKE
jgi:3D (Asp-Asp-Asp) domain-containing protein